MNNRHPRNDREAHAALVATVDNRAALTAVLGVNGYRVSDPARRTAADLRRALIAIRNGNNPALYV